MEVVECEDLIKCEVAGREEMEGCGVSEVESYRRRVEERCGELELEVVMSKSEYEALEAKYRALEGEKRKLEDVIEGLKRGSGGIEGQGNSGVEVVVDLSEGNLEEDKMFQLMLENKALECEKKSAEREAEAWKQKYKELELRMLKLDKNLGLKGGELGVDPVGGSLEANRITKPIERINLVEGTPFNDTRCERHHSIGEEKGGASLESDRECGRARKQLKFREDSSPCKKIAPPTPGGGVAFSTSVINISDSDDELPILKSQTMLPTDNQGSRNVLISSDCVGNTVGCGKDVAMTSFSKQAHTDNNVEEDIGDYEEAILPFSTPKRKRASRVVTSDSESSDDNIPISAVKRRHLREGMHDQEGSDLNGCFETASAPLVDNGSGSVTSPRRSLVRLRKCGTRDETPRNYLSQTSETKIDCGIPRNTNVEGDESEEVASESEGESLGGFIVSSSDVSENNDASSETNGGSSDDDVNFDEILTFQRQKDRNPKWEFEGDMLAAFGKDPELCMKAVCALYRQQTAEEKISKGSLCYNSRGFSKFDAFRGSSLAEFITGGNPNADLKVTVEELHKRDPNAIEQCRTYAIRYSKQLFEIYKNKEDPLFLPC